MLNVLHAPHVLNATLTIAVLTLLVACSPDVATSISATAIARATPALTDAPPSVASTSPTRSPRASAGLPFEGDAILDYYRQVGLSCGDPEPSSEADGWTVRECRGRDDAGRELLVGLATDSSGALGDGYARVKGQKGRQSSDPRRPSTTCQDSLGRWSAMPVRPHCSSGSPVTWATRSQRQSPVMYASPLIGNRRAIRAQSGWRSGCRRIRSRP